MLSMPAESAKALWNDWRGALSSVDAPQCCVLSCVSDQRIGLAFARTVIFPPVHPHFAHAL
jgi:hypothetical protein